MNRNTYNEVAKAVNHAANVETALAGLSDIVTKEVILAAIAEEYASAVPLHAVKDILIYENFNPVLTRMYNRPDHIKTIMGAQNIFNPVLNDTEFENIKTRTAVDEIRIYDKRFPDSDPLNFKKYENNSKGLLSAIAGINLYNNGADKTEQRLREANGNYDLKQGGGVSGGTYYLINREAINSIINDRACDSSFKPNIVKTAVSGEDAVISELAKKYHLSENEIRKLNPALYTRSDGFLSLLPGSKKNIISKGILINVYKIENDIRTWKNQPCMTLKAPVSDTVRQLAIHTTGGVVTNAQVLIVVVPADDPVLTETRVANQDIDFFRPDGGYLDISPDMSVRAEIKTDQQRVIDYFLTPLKVCVSESLAER